MNVYDKLFEMVFTDDYPEAIVRIAKDAIVETLPIEQAEFMLDNAQRFDAEFGDGAYRDASARMQDRVQGTMLDYLREQMRGESPFKKMQELVARQTVILDQVQRTALTLIKPIDE